MLATCRARRALRGLLATALIGTTLAVVAGVNAPPAHAEEVYARPGDGVFTFEGHGWGHGHGLSQWGSEGAARQGATATQILDAYYPGTAQQVVAARTIRVLIGEDDHTDVVVRPATGLNVRDLATNTAYPLPSGPTRWRLFADSTGMHVQGYTSGWTLYALGGKTALSGPLQFEGPAQERLYFASGAARDYRGAMRAVRTGASTINVVNVLPLDDYLLGVVPRESPSSFRTEALKAQAIAARSYSTYKVDHAGTNSTYDICSTTSCQVYGGVRYISSGGSVTELEAASTTAAVQATARTVRTYNGAAIFAEFSSSNGGWSTNGSQPYLSAHADPWDAIASPNHYWTGRVTAAQLEARYPGVGHLLRIRVTRRDGNGDWGGRVKDVVLEGVNSSGSATAVSASGGGVYLANPWPQSSTGLRGSWWHITTGYDSTIVSTSAAPTLVRVPGNPKADLVTTIRNTGSSAWPVSGLHLAVAAPAGSADAMVGGSTTPGVYSGNVTHPGASTVAPGDVAKFVVHLDATQTAAGTYAKAYAVRIGTGAVFGQLAQWVVTVKYPTYASALVSFAQATPPAAGAQPSVRPDGTVVLPRNGSVTVNVKVRNTGDVTWPLNDNVMLGTSDDRYRESASYGSSWPAKSRAARATSVDGVSGATEVKPGQVGVFPLTLYGNGLTAGTTVESFEPAWFGWAWLPGAKLTLHIVRTDPAVARLGENALPPMATLKLLNYPGDKRTLVFRVRNVGGAAWPVNDGDVIGTANPTARTDALRTSAWLSPSRATRLYANATRLGATAVQPGEDAEFRVPIDPTNKTAATYGEWFKAMVASTGQLYGPMLGGSVTVGAATLSATVTKNTTGLVVPAGGMAAYTVYLKNTGNTTWWVNGSVRMSSPGPSPSYGTGWLSSIRPTAIDANITRPGATTVLPGEVARFSFYVAANGRKPGTYTETLGAGWEAWRSTGLHIPVTYVIK
jgi:SpoIID/LytB domain protein